MYFQSQLMHSALTADFILINKKKSGEMVMVQLLKQVVETWMSDCQVTRHLIQKVWARNNFVLVTLSTTHPTPSPTYHPNCVVPRLQPNFLAKVNNQLILPIKPNRSSHTNFVYVTRCFLNNTCNNQTYSFL